LSRTFVVYRTSTSAIAASFSDAESASDGPGIAKRRQRFLRIVCLSHRQTI
jgi:hypothetical protein